MPAETKWKRTNSFQCHIMVLYVHCQSFFTQFQLHYGKKNITKRHCNNLMDK